MNSKTEYYRNYYAKNKDKYKKYMEKMKQKTIYCNECKTEINYLSYSPHKKSRKHTMNSENYNKNDAVLEKKLIEVLRKLIDF
jgi:hypothetical protein